MTIYVDTSAFIALMDLDSKDSPVARETWTRLVTEDAQLVTSNYVVVETCALLHHRIGLNAVRTFLEDLLPAVLVDWVDPATHRSAVNGLLMSSRKGPNIVDCVSFAVMRRLGISRVFTLDRHFTDQGFEVVG